MAGPEGSSEQQISVPQTRQYPGDRVFDAGEYDHVFDVELGDGIMRKLPFNNGSNMLETADMFCARENLSRVNVEQIVGFLKQNGSTVPSRVLPQK